MEIIKSQISVYEVEIDLKKWQYNNSNETPGFYDALFNTIPSLNTHKCMEGKIGGFFNELRNGTNFAHIIEHILLELIHIADPNKKVYSGWTRKKNGNIYVIHYGAPDFLTGGLAVILSIEIVKKLINSENISLDYYIQLLKNPVQYFVQNKRISHTLAQLVETNNYAHELENNILNDTSIDLNTHQTLNIKHILEKMENDFPGIIRLWKKEFIKYSGTYGELIINKIEMINLDKFIGIIKKGEIQSYTNGISNISEVIKSYNIPMHFVVYSTWLYKNNFLTKLIKKYKKDVNFLSQSIKDFEDLYQIVFKKILDAFVKEKPIGIDLLSDELKEFRELQEEKATIFVVDDDDMIRNATLDILKLQGFNTICAKNGIEALEIFVKRKDKISLVILDVIMPGISGLEVLSRLKKLHPEIKILLTSGYPEGVNENGLPLNNSVYFIGKPFSYQELLDKIKSILNPESENVLL